MTMRAIIRTLAGALLIAAAAAAPARAQNVSAEIDTAQRTVKTGDGATTVAAAAQVGVTPIEIREGDRQRSLDLPLGKGRVVKLPSDARDVLVANPEIADVVLKTPRTVFLLGRQVGYTNVFFLDQAGVEIFRAEIHVGIDATAVTRAMASLLPNTNVKVTAVNSNLFLTGNVRSPQLSENARQIALRFVEDEASVVNLLSVIEDQQVLLQVRVAEVSRSVLKELGLTFFDAASGSVSTITSENFTNTFSSAATFRDQPFLSNVFRFDRGTGDILTLVVNALERNGLIRTLAEPNLTAISGEPANFLVGGEFPVPVPQENNIAIEYRPFGIGLNFTPVVLDAGRISLRISTEVSALSTDGAISVQTISVPALSVRRAETTVELPSGGSLIIAGLLQDDIDTRIAGIPGLKDLPVLGALFRSSSFQRQETELVVAVTTYLVKPIERNQVRLPTEGLASPSDYDMYMLGRLHAVYANDDQPSAAGTLRGPIGYILE